MTTILIVDDNINNIDVLSGFLRNHGHRILVATSGEKALKTVDRLTPDLILLDVMMPGMDGFAVCQKLKANPTTAAIPILFLTAKTETESMLQGFQVGGADYILKPFHQEEVLARLQVHLHNQTLLQTKEALVLELQQAHQQLEQKVAERTQQLSQLNAQLIQEKNTAEQATKTKDKFVSLVAHDLRAPLQGMKGYVQCVLDEFEQMDTRELKLFFHKIMSCVDHQSAMINGILNISRFHSGQISLRPRFLDAYFLAAAAIDKVLFYSQQKGVVIDNQIARGHRIYADDYLFGEVLSNLLSNAIKFSTAGQTITLTLTYNEHQQILINIQDQGCGLSEKIIPNLFRLEVKTSTLGTAGEKGSGLGLPYSQDIMHLHGGKITVQSNPGQGSLFSACLPIVIPQVMVVDDDPVCHKVLLDYLQPFQAEVTIANDGHQALAHAAAKAYHLVITDIRMPEMDGFELLKQLKTQLVTEQIPVMLITAYDDMTSRQHCFDLGGDDYVTKPFSTPDFIPRIRRFIGPNPTQI